jgi:hypothetical protein
MTTSHMAKVRHGEREKDGAAMAPTVGYEFSAEAEGKVPKF